MTQIVRHRLIGIAGIFGVGAFFGLFTILPMGSDMLAAAK